MAIDFGGMPNLSVTPQVPAFNPVEAQTKQATLSGLLSENALRSQLAPLQVQEQAEKAKQAAITTELQQIALNDQKALGKYLQEGDANEETAPGATSSKIATMLGIDPKDPMMHIISGMEKQGMSGPGLVIQAQGILQRRTEYNKGTEEQQKIIKDNYDVWKDAMGQLFNEKDPSHQSLMLAEMLPRLQTATHLSPELDSMLNLLRTNPAQGIPVAYNLVAAQDKALGLSKAAAQTKEAEQKVIPEGAAMSPETKQQIQKDIAVATNPEIQHGKEAVAAAEGQARANIEAATARGSNAALANVPPHLVAPASAAAEKAGVEYAAAKSVSDRMAATMAAARQGNVVAYQIIPQEGTLQITTSQGVHRINKTEIDQYAGGGSLWQRMQGHFGKALTGKSIPDSVLNDMADIQKIQAEGAKAKYENSLATINQTYGANFQSVEMKAPPSGGGKTYTQADVDAAVAAHPGMTAAQIEAAFKKKNYTKQ